MTVVGFNISLHLDSNVELLSTLDKYLNKMESKEHILNYLAIRERKFKDTIETLMNKNRDVDME